jgi:hypothetical protein
MYRCMDSTTIFLDLPSRYESNSPAANSPYPYVLLHAINFQATFGLTASGAGSPTGLLGMLLMVRVCLVTDASEA